MAKIIWTPEERKEREEAKRKEQEEKNRKERRFITKSRLCAKKLDACYAILNVPLGPNRRLLDATALKRYFYKILYLIIVLVLVYIYIYCY